ncbi:MAG: hypothetical protein HFE04_03030 [Bacilli bacterium]|nr:hypothetical protein [Bacilli bacterium]
MKKKIIDKIEEITPRLIIIFLYLQPFLDILASYLIRNNIPNYITSTIRMAFMVYMIIYLILAKYENKKKIITYLTIIITTILIHITTIYIYKGPIFLNFEIKNTLSTYYFIILLISFLSIWQKHEIDKKHIKNILLIYILFTFIPGILNISYESYNNSKIGKVGWFYSANVIGSLIIILFSSIIPTLKNSKKTYTILVILMLIYIVFTIGTKTPVLGLAIIIGINLMYYLYKLIKTKNKKIKYIPVILIALVVTGIIIVPKTNFYKNLETHLTYIKKNNIDSDVKGFIDHFIFSTRLKNEEETRKYYKKSQPLEKIFGIGYIESYEYDEEKYKVIEIDYFDVYYKEGIIGFIIYFLPVVYITIKIIKKTKLNFESINNLGTILLILLIALFQGHIFVTPQSSIYISILLVTIYKAKGEENGK